MVAGWRQDEDRVHAPSDRGVGGNGGPLVLALADDRLERVNVRLDLEQGRLAAAIQAQAGRPPAGPRHGCFDLGPPAGVSEPEQEPARRRRATMLGARWPP